MEALPELQSAELDSDGLEQLLSDIFSLTTIQEMRVKAAPGRRSASGQTPEQLRQALKEGHAVQLVYKHDGKLWMDTLLPGAAGVKLVRIERGDLRSGSTAHRSGQRHCRD